MSSRNSLFFKWSKSYPILKKIFLYYNVYIRNFKFSFNNSQFGEDKKILKLFKNKRQGTYLDLGCFHPIRQNNTYLFHKMGWKGINIDLNPLTIELFNYFRPKDININSAISDSEEKKEMYFIDELNTQNTLERNHLEFLKKHHSVKDEEISIMQIETIKLDRILEQYNFKKIDFMNIDIEGHEINVLKSLRFFS